MGKVLDFEACKYFKKDKGGSGSNDNTSNTLLCPFGEKFETKLDNLEKRLNTFGTCLALILTAFIFAISLGVSSILKSNEAYKKDTDAKFEIIQLQFNNQKEINNLQIQRDVAVEIKNQKK